MKLLLSLLICLMVLAKAGAGEPYHTTHERKTDPREQTVYMQEIRSYMDSIVFPEVALSKMSLPEAVDRVRSQIPNLAPASVPPDKRREFGVFLKLHLVKAETVSVSLHRATLPEVLDAICAEHDYIWYLAPYALAIVPRSEAFPDNSALPNAREGAPANR